MLPFFSSHSRVPVNTASYHHRRGRWTCTASHHCHSFPGNWSLNITSPLCPNEFPGDSSEHSFRTFRYSVRISDTYHKTDFREYSQKKNPLQCEEILPADSWLKNYEEYYHESLYKLKHMILFKLLVSLCASAIFLTFRCSISWRGKSQTPGSYVASLVTFTNRFHRSKEWTDTGHMRAPGVAQFPCPQHRRPRGVCPQHGLRPLRPTLPHLLRHTSRRPSPDFPPLCQRHRPFH